MKTKILVTSLILMCVSCLATTNTVIIGSGGSGSSFTNMQIWGTNSLRTNGTFPAVTLDFPVGFPSVPNNNRLTIGDYNLFIYSSDGSDQAHQNPAHSGHPEWQENHRRISFLIGDYNADGTGAMQLGASSFGSPHGSRALFYVNPSKFGSSTNVLGYSQLWQWVGSYWNGSVETRSPIYARSEALATNGMARLSFGSPTYSGFANSEAGPAFDEAVGVNSFEIVTGASASQQGIIYHGSLARDVISAVPSTTNYGVNWEGVSEVYLALSGTNINFTNVPSSSGRFFTNQSSEVVMYINTGLAVSTTTYPTNWHVYPPGINQFFDNNIYKLSARKQVVSGTTNYYVDYIAYTNAIALDVDATKFFTASGITDATIKFAVNNLVLDLKNNSLWTRWDAIYPLVGGTSNTCSWNLANTNNFRMAWTVGSSTFAANGWTSDGSASFGDTGLNPSTASSPNYVQNSATIAVFNATAAPTLTTRNYFIGSTSSVRAGLLMFSTSFFGVDGFNDGNGFVVVSNPSPFDGFSAATRTGGSSSAVYTRTGSNFDSASSTGVPTFSFYIGARNAAGSMADPIGARLTFVMIGAGITSGEYLTLSNIVNTFETSLGR